MIEYTREGTGPLLLYVCGIEGTGRLFYKQTEDLRHDYTVISYPLRATLNHTLEDLADDIAWIIRDAGFTRATIVAESFGGLPALLAAWKYPALAERLLLSNTFPYFLQRGKINLAVAIFSILPYAMLRRYRTRPTRSNLFGAEIPAADQKSYREYTRDVAYPGYLARLRIIKETDLRPRLAQIQTPTLILAGTDDEFTPSVAAARELAAALPRHRLKLLTGLGHLSFLGAHTAVREWLQEFATI
jgi:pimeloyl-ACP methyl ester carboxylesterase